MSTFQQTKVWHSHLRNVSPLTIMFTSDVMDSNYSDDKIRFFQVFGESGDGHYYLIENDRILEKIKEIPNRRWVTISATGGDTESADVTISEADTSASGGSGGTNASGATLPVAARYLEALRAAQAVIEQVPELQEDTTALLNVTASLYIQWNREGQSTPLMPVIVESEETLEDTSEDDTEDAEEDASEDITGDDDLPF